MMAAADVNKKEPGITMDLPECPVCMDTMTAPVFQCQTGHSLCNSCTSSLVPPVCPICRKGMTQIRNWQLEEILNKAKVICPHKSSGCGYTMVNAILENHVKECIFRDMGCPLGAVFGKCFWQGKLQDMMEHFKDRHAEYCKARPEADIVVDNIETDKDDRHFFLVSQGKMLFIITFKLDTLQKMAYWTVQLIGSKVVAKQYIYEIHVTSNRDTRRKASYSEHCFNDVIKADEIFRLGMCVMLPLEYLTHFIRDKKLTFRFSIRWTPTPKSKKEKSGGSNEGQPAKQGPPTRGTVANQDRTPKDPGSPKPL